jgi:hypothetical protein
VPQPIPNLFIIGTPRSGTTSVAKWLSRHPDVAGGRRKEPVFHATDLPSPKHTTDLEEYLQNWAGTESVRMRLDASVWYLFSKEAATSIARMSPDARFIVHLRDPVDLIASLHTHHVFIGVETVRDFETAVFGERPPPGEEFRRSIDYLDVVRLPGQLRRFYEHFPEDRFAFVDFEQLAQNPEGAHLTLLDDLGLSRAPLSEYPHLNRGRRERVAGMNRRLGRGRKTPAPGRISAGRLMSRLNTVVGRSSVDPEMRRRILNVIGPEIDELAELLDRDLSDWKRV